MPLKRLKPIDSKDSWSDAVQKEIEFHLYDLIYRPLLEILKTETGLKVKENSRASLVSALRAGRVTYRDGYFVGELNASVSKDLRSHGAVFDKTRKAFKIDLDRLPFEIKQAVSASNQKTDAIVSKIKDELDRIEENADSLTYKIDFHDQVEKIISGLDDQFHKTVVQDFAVEPVLDEKTKATLQAEYNKNLNFYIKGWRDEAIFRLRTKVEKNVFSGYRSDRMIEMIQSEKNVSDGKAKFLASQETRLLTSAYREERYKETGVERYLWSTSHDRRVRDRHRHLDGQIFSWDNPPVVDLATGRRAHAGTDYNCRCVPVPVYDERDVQEYKALSSKHTTKR